MIVEKKMRIKNHSNLNEKIHDYIVSYLHGVLCGFDLFDLVEIILLYNKNEVEDMNLDVII